MPLPKKIVYVDDDQDDRDLYREALTCISNAELVLLPEARELDAYLETTGAPPDLIVMDINMPGERGVDVALRLKDSDSFAHVPLVIFSTTISPTDAQRMDSHGIPYLTKPGSFRELCGMLEKLVEEIDRN